jgi:hypothetical protein
MACEKYLAWMTDASLGALAPGREPELLAHAATCDACRQTYLRAGELAAFVDRSVASLVSANPSPHFATRLRARLAAEPAPARFRQIAWIPVAAGALALASVILVLMMRSPSRSNPNHIANAIPESPLQAAAANIPTLPASVAPGFRPGFVRHVSARNPPAHEPLVLVEPGQFAAVVQFSDAVREGRMDGAGLLAADQPLEKLLDVAPIEIAPLDVPQTETPAAPAADNSSRH